MSKGMGGISVIAINVENLYKKYGKQMVLRGVSLKILEGEFYALMGPNGAGKTTLAGVIASVILPTEGKVEKSTGRNLSL